MPASDFASQLSIDLSRGREAPVGHSRACKFDLRALVPVPDAVLLRGPYDPAALDWLRAHWGTTQTLRLVADDPSAAAVLRTRVPARQAVFSRPWRSRRG